MAFDIYGCHLRPGHCEVHPDVHEEYPCFVCLSEMNAKKERPQQRPLCDICGKHKAVTGANGYGVCSEECSNVAAQRHDAEASLRANGNLTVVNSVLDELQRAVIKFPQWPTDPLHAMGIVAEEVGELAKEVLQFVYKPHKSSREAIHKEALQAAAMLLRFLESLHVYEYRRAEWHTQPQLQESGDE